MAESAHQAGLAGQTPALVLAPCQEAGALLLTCVTSPNCHQACQLLTQQTILAFSLQGAASS